MKRKRWVAVLALAASQLAPCALRGALAQEVEIKGELLVEDKVGVGTTTPDVQLHLSETNKTAIKMSSSATASATMIVRANDNTSFFTDDADRTATNWIARDTTASMIGLYTGTIVFRTNSGLTAGDSFGPSTRMAIDSGGNVGIGTASPASRLHVKGTDAEIKFVTDLGSGLIFSDPTPQDPNAYVFRAYDEGAIFVFQTEDPVTTQTIRLWMSSDGKIAIADDAPAEKLDVDGVIRIRDNGGHPGTPSDSGNVYAHNGEIWVMNSGGFKTQISTHADPRIVAPSAQSSFADLEVTLPFSFHHESDLIGKGSVVDMAKMVGFVEEMMQASLGVDEGRLVLRLRPADHAGPDAGRVERRDRRAGGRSSHRQLADDGLDPSGAGHGR